MRPWFDTVIAKRSRQSKMKRNDLKATDCVVRISLGDTDCIFIEMIYSNGESLHSFLFFLSIAVLHSNFPHILHYFWHWFAGFYFIMQTKVYKMHQTVCVCIFFFIVPFAVVSLIERRRENAPHRMNEETNKDVQEK